MSGTDGAAKQAKSFAKPLKHGKSLLKAASFEEIRVVKMLNRAMTSRPTVQAARKQSVRNFLDKGSMRARRSGKSPATDIDLTATAKKPPTAERERPKSKT